MVSKVLVANRGEIACRILRACHEAGLATVAIYAQNDADSMFIELADEAVLLTGNTIGCLLYTSPSPRDRTRSRMPSSA